MASPYELKIAANTSQVVRPMAQLEDTLGAAADALDAIASSSGDAGEEMQDTARATERAADRMADALDDAGKDITREADDAADKMERSFRDSLGDIVREGKTTGRKLGDDVREGTERAEEGMEELSDSARSNAMESAASFRGEFDDVADFITDVVSEAFAGFGPMGVAAGVAAAVGIGALIGGLETAAEKATEAKESAVEMGEALADVDLDSRLLANVETLREKLGEIADEKQWWEVWQAEPVTVLEQLAAAADEFGLDFQQMANGVSGDSDQLTAALAAVNSEIDRQNAAAWDVTDALTGMTTTIGGADAELLALRASLDQASAAQATAAEHAEWLTRAEDGLNDALTDATEATEEYETAVADSLDAAGQSWQDYVTDGIVNLDAYASAMEAQMQAVAAFEDNLVTASSSMSAEALDYIRRMGPEAAPLLQAFIDAPLSEQQRLAGIWDQLGRVTTDHYAQSTQLGSVVDRKISEAQSVANGRPISISTMLDSTGLQSAITNVVNGLHIPAAVVRVRLGQSAE